MTNDSNGKGTPVRCRNCDAPMTLVRMRKHPGPWPYILMVLGIFFSLFIVGPLVGVPMLILGLYMALSSEVVSLCSDCGAYFKVMLVKTKERS